MTARPLLALLALALAAPAAGAQSAADCVARYAPCHVDARLHMAGIESERDARDFLARLKAAASAGDRRALAGMVRYPLTVHASGATYADAAALRADFDAVFTPRVLAAVEAAAYGTLFVNDQGAMIGDGEVWLDGWDGRVLIKAINP